MKIYITVWECRSVDGKQVVVLEQGMRVDDYMYQHEFQRIIYRGIRSGWIAGCL